MTRFTAPLLLVAFSAVLVACGDDDESTETTDSERTIEIDMVDIAFEPSEVEVAAGETVRFVFTNTGAVAHDAFIGDAEAQAAHGEEMAESQDGGHGEEEENAITVEPGETGELTYEFTEDDDGLLIGCHQPGHYEAGMVVTIDLT